MDLISFIYNPITLLVTTMAIALAIFMIKKKLSNHLVVGTVINQLLNFNRQHDYMTNLSRKHRTYRMLGLGLVSSRVYTVDPVVVEYILKTKFDNYGKGKYQHEGLSDLLGDGIFTVDGEKWRHQRKSSSSQFSTRMLKQFSDLAFKENAKKLAKIVSEAAASNKTLEFQDLFMKSTLDSICEIMLGVELDSLGGTYGEGMRFSNAFDKASEITLYHFVDVFWRIKRYLNIGSEAVCRDCNKVVEEFINKIIQQKLETPQNDLMKKGDMLSRFIESDQNNVNYLKDIMLSFITAGKDTTAGTLCWFIYMLCKNPTVQEKIAEEATRISNDSRIDDDVAGNIEKMQYLRAALTETLRLYPAVPQDVRCCFSDDTLPGGLRVQKGEIIGYLPYAMGRMKFLWGEDAEEFRPERWLDRNGFFQAESPFKFSAFQAGPRICLGKEFAYRQMKIFAAVLLRCFRFKLGDDNEKEAQYKVMLNLHMDGGLNLQAFPRLKCLDPRIS